MAELSNYYVTFGAVFKRPGSVLESSGEELAKLLAEELPSVGVDVAKVEDDVFCHYVVCIAGASKIELMVGFDQANDHEDRWYVQVCEKQTLFGRSTHPQADCQILLAAVNKVLRAAESVWDIRWYPHFEVAEYLALLPAATGPMEPEDEALVHPLIRSDRALNRVSAKIASPLSAIVAMLLFAALSIWIPQYVGGIAAVLFLAALVVLVILPTIVARKIHREGNRIFAEEASRS